jgi:3D (Asp-Asp-Asp) domain-containing protein
MILIAMFTPLCVSAEDEGSSIQFTPQVTIPDSQFTKGAPVAMEGVTLGEWIAAVYAFLAGTMGIIAAVMVMWGGIKWLTAAGNTGRVQDAKETVYSAVMALLLTLGAYVLLYSINPNLVKFRDLSSLVGPIPTIQQLTSQLVPRRISEVILTDPGLATTKNQFNALGCPSEQEMKNGFNVFLTGYYRPAWPADADMCKSSGGYPNFPCNVAMQCSCEHITSEIQCTKECTAGSFVWKPCDLKKLDQNNYCNATASGSRPVGMIGDSSPFTAAASECFGFGTRFTLSREGDESGAFATNTKWAVDDRGGDIKGRHLDLFTGTGDQARAEALKLTGVAKMYVEYFCPRKGECVDFSEEEYPVPMP